MLSTVDPSGAHDVRPAFFLPVFDLYSDVINKEPFPHKTKAYTLTEAKRALENYCAYQERAHSEVVEKLRGMRMIPEAIDAVVDHLIQEDFLNEERFARAYVRGKFNQKHWGKKRLIQGLKQKQLSAFAIKAGMSELIELDYRGSFETLARRITETTQGGKTAASKKKIADYLLYRGWESEWVYDWINQLK